MNRKTALKILASMVTMVAGRAVYAQKEATAEGTFTNTLRLSDMKINSQPSHWVFHAEADTKFEFSIGGRSRTFTGSELMDALEDKQ